MSSVCGLSTLFGFVNFPSNIAPGRSLSFLHTAFARYGNGLIHRVDFTSIPAIQTISSFANLVKSVTMRSMPDDLLKRDVQFLHYPICFLNTQPQDVGGNASEDARCTAGTSDPVRPGCQ